MDEDTEHIFIDCDCDCLAASSDLAASQDHAAFTAWH